MRCDECQPLVEEYFDGELDQTTGLQLSQHLETCSVCSTLLNGLAAEHDVYGAYKPDVEMSGDLWPRVRAQLATETVARKEGRIEVLRAQLKSAFALPPVSVWAAAALVVVAVGLTVAFMSYFQSQQDHPQVAVSQESSEAAPATPPELPAATEAPGSETPTETVDKSGVGSRGKKEAMAAERRNQSRPRVSQAPQLNQSKTPNQLVREAEQKYLAAIAMLSRTAEGKRSRLDAVTLARLEQALASIDRTIVNTRKAARQHPDDPVAVQYMLTAYSKKVDVLREIVDHE